MSNFIKVKEVKYLYYTQRKGGLKNYFIRFGSPTTTTKNLKTESLTLAKKLIPLIVNENMDVVSAKAKINRPKLTQAQKVLTFGKAFNDYMSVAKGTLSDTEYKNRLSKFNNHVLKYKAEGDSQYLAQKDITKLTYSYFQTMFNTLDMEHISNIRDCSPKSQKNIKGMLQALYTFYRKEGTFDLDPLKDVEIRYEDNHVELQLNNQQILDLYSNIFNMPTNTLVEIKRKLFFMFSMSGRRKSEVLTLEWTDFNIDKRVVVIQAKNSKSKKAQHIELTDWLFDLLMVLKSRIQSIHSDGYIFLNLSTNNRYTNFDDAFKNLKEQSGITSKFRAHDFRHLMGTIYVRQMQGSLEKASEALTHSDTKVTKDFYIDRTNNNTKIVPESVMAFLGIQNKQESSCYSAAQNVPTAPQNQPMNIINYFESDDAVIPFDNVGLIEKTNEGFVWVYTKYIDVAGTQYKFSIEQCNHYLAWLSQR